MGNYARNGQRAVSFIASYAHPELPAELNSGREPAQVLGTGVGKIAPELEKRSKRELFYIPATPTAYIFMGYSC